MGCKSKRIGVAELLQLCGVRASELFASGEHRGESVNAGDEVAEIARVGEMRCAAPARRFRADPCDLAAAHGDPEAQAVLDIEDEKLELKPQRRIEEELAERRRVLRDVRELRHALAQHLGPLAKRIAGKQGAQDDPDQLHGSQYDASADPG
jgi:hypothetical protein